MEFQGRIAKLLPIRQGVSQRTGNEWKSLPFIFEYFEHESDRYADTVMLETFDTNVIDHLKEGMEVICGFGHKAKTITKQDGTQTTINEMRLYKIESVRKANANTQQQDPGARMQQMLHNDQMRVEAQAQAMNQTKEPDDDLPF
jgi:hypothetical protein